MIPRYEVPEISALWSDHNKFSSYLKVELALLSSLEGKLIPVGAAKAFDNVEIKPERIDEIEKETRHDVIAFCTSITEQVDAKASKYFHFGVTSSDIIDTATNLQIKDSLALVIENLENLLLSLETKANETKHILCLGRSHGMYAEPTSFGLKFLSSYAEFKRRLNEYKDFYHNEMTAQFSGAVGNYTILSPEIENEAAKKLGLKVEEVSTQVIPRDRIAKLITIGSLVASAIDRLSTEIRLLHHSDVGEINEGFAKGQKGSSTMPHKKNPISGENLCGMARVLRSHIIMALENIPLWHERDISHSSTERMYLPDHFGLLCYSLKRLSSTVNNLVIHQEKIEEKVFSQAQYLSSFYLHFFIENTDSTREELYTLIQEASFKTSDPLELSQLIHSLAKNKGIDTSKLPELNKEKVREIFTKYVDQVFKRTV